VEVERSEAIDLRENTQQPEAYLKEVLAEIGHLERSGPNHGTWTLQENYTTAVPEVRKDEMEAGGSQDLEMVPYNCKMEYSFGPSQDNSEFKARPPLFISNHL